MRLARVSEKKPLHHLGITDESRMYRKEATILAKTGCARMAPKGCVHRDLKMHNILIAKGVAKVTDFGLALLKQTAQRGAGTPGYAATD
eukprot:4732172-Amphidinium_carterae.1